MIPNSDHAEFLLWLQTPIGKKFLTIECQYITDLYFECALSRQILVLGNKCFAEPLQTNINKTCIDCYDLPYDITSLSCIGHLKDNNYNVTYLPHLLEFSSDPALVLSIAYDTLCDGGYLVVTNFNLFSLLALSKLNKRSLDRWPHRWVSSLKIASLSKDLNFECIKTQYFAYGLPYFQGLEGLWSIPCGGSYIAILEKRSIPLDLVMA